MKSLPIRKIICLTLAYSCALPFALNASINLTGGGADVTFYYESAEDRWDIVLREKGSTQATGLDTAYTGFDGIVGLGTDFEFSNLTTTMIGLRTQEVNGIDYFIYSANGSSIFPSGTADLGVRTRLFEDQTVLGTGGDSSAHQFENLRLSLNLSESTFASPNAELVVFGCDSVGLGEVDNILYETAAATPKLSHDWPNWDHIHIHWGFSERGDYTLVFDVEGIGGIHGDDASATQFEMTFAVPEPGAFGAIAGVFAIAAVAVRRRKRLN